MKLDKAINKVYQECAKRPSSVASKYYTSEELAAVVRYSKRWVVKWRGTGRIPGTVRVGRQWRFDKVIIDKLIAAGTFDLLD